MKKKHRDIVVDGVQYGWTMDGCYRVKIWKDKKVIAKYEIEYHHDAVTPKMIAALIKDPEDAIKWLNANPCPFCGALVEPVPEIDSGVNDALHDEYFICNHEDDCFFTKTSSQKTWLKKEDIENWNKS